MIDQNVFRKNAKTAQNRRTVGEKIHAFQQYNGTKVQVSQFLARGTIGEEQIQNSDLIEAMDTQSFQRALIDERVAHSEGQFVPQNFSRLGHEYQQMHILRGARRINHPVPPFNLANFSAASATTGYRKAFDNRTALYGSERQHGTMKEPLIKSADDNASAETQPKTDFFSKSLMTIAGRHVTTTLSEQPTTASKVGYKANSNLHRDVRGLAKQAYENNNISITEFTENKSSPELATVKGEAEIKAKVATEADPQKHKKTEAQQNLKKNATGKDLTAAPTAPAKEQKKASRPEPSRNAAQQ